MQFTWREVPGPVTTHHLIHDIWYGSIMRNGHEFTARVSRSGNPPIRASVDSKTQELAMLGVEAIIEGVEEALCPCESQEFGPMPADVQARVDEAFGVKGERR